MNIDGLLLLTCTSYIYIFIARLVGLTSSRPIARARLRFICIKERGIVFPLVSMATSYIALHALLVVSNTRSRYSIPAFCLPSNNCFCSFCPSAPISHNCWLIPLFVRPLIYNIHIDVHFHTQSDRELAKVEEQRGPRGGGGGGTRGPTAYTRYYIKEINKTRIRIADEKKRIRERRATLAYYRLIQSIHHEYCFYVCV